MTSFRSRTLTEYIQIIWRRKLLIFLLATGMLISTFFLIDRLPNIYESRATVVTPATTLEVLRAGWNGVVPFLHVSAAGRPRRLR